ncbi:hypothetical protein [Aquimarina agarilytica]|uniref:hypothetical protein n=1 Tax=Aquimarina agarilytica TaxID=1087449 RepID=UPI0002DC7CC5|nr:hypothetical protein [Aquimarina agarilytica]
MRKIILIVFLIPFLFAFQCENEETPKTTTATTLLGKWQLIEILADPGDGSGTFQPIENGEVIEFKNDNAISGLTGLDNCSNKATYSKTTNKITFANCDNTLSFKINGENLFIYPPCFEACANKYKKIN